MVGKGLAGGNCKASFGNILHNSEATQVEGMPSVRSRKIDDNTIEEIS